MAKTLILAENPLEPSTWTSHEVEDVCDFLKERLGHWPKTARIYNGQVCEANDVTPRDHMSSYALRQMGEEKPYFAVIYPEDPVTAIIAAVAVIAIGAIAFLFPRMPNANNNVSGSSNNSLSARTNEARINGRIPDIFGKVRAYPDLLTTPFTAYQNGVPVEISYMCVGRGSYELEKARDGETLLSAIAGASAAFYGPNTSPNSGDAPQLQVGSAISEPILAVTKMNDVNGQTLRPPNSNNVRGDDNMRFVYPDVIERSGSEVDFTDHFDPGDSVAVSNASYAASTGPTTLTATKVMRFEAGGTIRFQSYNPTTEFAAGDTVQLSSASYTGPGDATPYTLVWTPASFPSGHSTVLDRVKMVKLVGANPAKFYRVYHLFFKDIGTRAQINIYQSDDAAGTNSVSVAAWVVASGATNSGEMTVVLAAQGGSGITGEATVDFGDGTTAFSTYNGTYANSGMGTPTVQTGGTSGTVAVDLVGTYVVASLTSTTMVLTTASTVNPDWSRLTDLANDRTEYETSVLSKEVPAVTLNLAGTFTVLSVSASQLVLSNPATTNPDWGTKLQNLPGGATPYLSPSIATTGVNWVGGFVVDVTDLDRVLANFLAPQGLYQINKKGKQRPNSVTVEVELEPVDDDDVPTGPAESFQTTLTGDDVSKDQVGKSLWCMPTFTGRCKVRARRLTHTNLDFEGTWVDEVKWADGFGMARVAEDHFGDVTTVMTRTVATQGALSMKSRKFSVVATRKLPQRDGDGFTETLHPTLNVADMICAAALDPRIGGRELWEIDVDGIYDTVDEVEEYFGTPEAVQFCHTFDQSDTSFEETIQAMASATFCTAFRQGSTISLRFEKPTEDSVLLLNHRNKEPGTETRTVSFGVSEGYDGVSVDYVDPDDDAPVTKFAPQDDASALKAKKVETIGIRSHIQAHFHAWRAWNKLRFQHEALEVNVEEEADAVVLSERVLVADNTRSSVMDGEVTDQTGLMLELSQPIAMEEGEDYVIFLQLSDGTVQRIAVTPGVHNDEVVLAEAPTLPLVLDAESFATTTYVVASSEGSRAAAPFIVTEKEELEDGRYRISAVNYDERYYQNDKDHIDGLV